MRNFCNFYKKCQNLATSKHAQISSIFSTQSLLVKWNKGSLVEQHILKKYFSHVSLDHTNIYIYIILNNILLYIAVEAFFS